MPLIPFEPTKDPTLAARVERAARMAYLKGLRDPAVAKEVGVKATTLRDWKKRPEWINTINALREVQRQHAEEKLSRLAEKAVSAVEECLDSEIPTVKLRAATWILERSGIEGTVRSGEGPTEFENYLRANAD